MCLCVCLNIKVYCGCFLTKGYLINNAISFLKKNKIKVRAHRFHMQTGHWQIVACFWPYMQQEDNVGKGITKRKQMI